MGGELGNETYIDVLLESSAYSVHQISPSWSFFFFLYEFISFLGWKS